MHFNLPNTLTWLRILMIPVFTGVYYAPATWLSLPEKNLVATVIFAAAAITDWLDGYLARRLEQTSAFGAFLDPVADKLMVAAALIILVNLDRADPLLAVIIIGREIAISALREWMAKLGQSASMAVALLGKVKTAAQMAAIVLLLLDLPLPGGLHSLRIGTFCLWLAAVLTLWSMVYYLRLAAPYLKSAPK
jgi:CDP-diacylglycerol--glycerol-3-phosphate 3-phosphatidyltransferase